MPDGCVWYSFGSDKTGPALADALGFQASKKTPPFPDYKVVVGWGCKPGKRYSAEALASVVREGKTRILNHPEMVDRNRNKLETLERLQEAGISVPSFMGFDPRRPKVIASTVLPDKLEKGQLALPLVVLNEYNRGEPIFCYTIEDVEAALKGNTRKEYPYNYMRVYDHGDEYRIHVFRDTALFAQKKQLDEDPLEAMTETLVQKYRRRKKKDGGEVHRNLKGLTMEICGFLAQEILATSQLKKSVKTGWKYIDWNLDLVPAEVAGIAIEALDALHLDMGAVSVSHADGIPRVLSVTTAPALTAEQMAQYVIEIQDFTNTGGKERPRKKPELMAQKERKASPELVAKLYRKLKGLSAEKAEEVLESLEE